MAATWKTRVENLRLKTKFMLILCSLLLVFGAVILSASFLVFRQYENELYQNTSQMLNMAIDTVESDLDAVEQAGALTLSNDAVQNTLNDSRLDFSTREPVLLFGQASAQVYEALNYYYSKNPYILSASIYVDGQRFRVGPDYSPEPEENLEQAREAAAQGNGKAVWLPSGRSDSSLFYAREIRDIRNMTLRTIGLLVLRVDLRGIVEDRLKSGLNLNYQPQITIASRSGGLLFSDLPFPRQEAEALPAQNGYRRAILDGEDYFISYATRSRFGLSYALYLPIDSIAASLRLLNAAVLVIGVLTFLLCMLFCSRLVSQIIRHFDILVQKMHLFREGKFQEIGASSYSGRQDELGYLHRSFDGMVQDFRQLVEDNYLKQLAVKDARIKSLQAQLNPHFLFNILQTIHWKAKAAGQEDISRIAEALGKMLRYTLQEQEALVPLKKELEITRYYVSMQKYRYGERLEVAFAVPDAYSDAPIPPMGLQTLVENSIKHALENMLGACRICVSAREEGEAVLLSVEDNGPGIDEALLEHADRETDRGMGIGLSNLQQRLSLLLGKPYGVRIHNTGGGARVELLLPAGTAHEPDRPCGKEREEQDVSAAFGGR